MGLLSEHLANQAREKLLKQQQGVEIQKEKAYGAFTLDKDRPQEIQKLAGMVGPPTPEENQRSGGALGWLHTMLVGHANHLQQQQQDQQAAATGAPPTPSQQEQQVNRLNTSVAAAAPNPQSTAPVQTPQPQPQDQPAVPKPPVQQPGTDGMPYFASSPPPSFSPAPGPSPSDISRGLNGASQDLTGATGSQKSPLNAAAGAGVASPRAQAAAANPVPASIPAPAAPAAAPPVDPYARYAGTTLMDPRSAIILGQNGAPNIPNMRERAQEAALPQTTLEAMQNATKIANTDADVKANISRIQSNPDLKKVWDGLDDMQKYQAAMGQPLQRQLVPRTTFDPVRVLTADEAATIGNDLDSGQPFRAGDTAKPVRINGAIVGYSRADQAYRTGPSGLNPATGKYEQSTFNPYTNTPGGNRSSNVVPVSALPTVHSSTRDTIEKDANNNFVAIPTQSSQTTTKGGFSIPPPGGAGRGVAPHPVSAGSPSVSGSAGAGSAGASGGAPNGVRQLGVAARPPAQVMQRYEESKLTDQLAGEVQDMLNQLPEDARNAGTFDQIMQVMKARAGNAAYINGISPDEFRSTLMAKVDRLQAYGRAALQRGGPRAQQYSDIIGLHLPGSKNSYPLMQTKLTQMRRGLSQMQSLDEQGTPALKQLFPPPGAGDGKIDVIRKSDGLPGRVSPQFFDPAKYTKVH